MAIEVANHLEKIGADLAHVAICHVQKSPDKYYSARIKSFEKTEFSGYIYLNFQGNYPLNIQLFI